MTEGQQDEYNKLLDTARRRELYDPEKHRMKRLAELRVEELYDRKAPHYEWDIEAIKNRDYGIKED
jgi:hypothetical protein